MPRRRAMSAALARGALALLAASALLPGRAAAQAQDSAPTLGEALQAASGGRRFRSALRRYGIDAAEIAAASGGAEAKLRAAGAGGGGILVRGASGPTPDLVNAACPAWKLLNAQVKYFFGFPLYAGNIAACILITTVEGILIGKTNTTCPDRTAAGFGNQKPLLFLSQAGVPAPVQLQQVADLPDHFPPDQLQQLLPLEAATYSWLYQGIRNLAEWWPCSAEFGGGLTGYLSPTFSAPPMVPAVVPTAAIVPPVTNPLVEPLLSNPGVYTLKQLNLEPNKTLLATTFPKPPPEYRKYPYFSMYFDAVTPTLRMFVILIRGTNTRGEWLYDFEYNRVINSRFPNALPTVLTPYFEGETHSGFTRLFNATWPSIQQALLQYVIPPSGDPNVGVKYVTVAGQSAGGAVATLVAYAAQKFLNANWVDRQRLPNPPIVDLVTFGAPNVGNSAFRDSLKSLKVNVRALAFANDVVTTLPCQSNATSGLNAMPACRIAVVPTFRTATGQNVMSWPDYQPVYGVVPFGPNDMPTQQAAWAKTSVFFPVDGNLPYASHDCSYKCWPSQYNQANIDNQCLLANPADPLYTFCPGFPPPPKNATKV